MTTIRKLLHFGTAVAGDSVVTTAALAAKSSN